MSLPHRINSTTTPTKSKGKERKGRRLKVFSEGTNFKVCERERREREKKRENKEKKEGQRGREKEKEKEREKEKEIFSFFLSLGREGEVGKRRTKKPMNYFKEKEKLKKIVNIIKNRLSIV